MAMEGNFVADVRLDDSDEASGALPRASKACANRQLALRCVCEQSIVNDGMRNAGCRAVRAAQACADVKCATPVHIATQVIQLPIVKHKLKKLLSTAVKKTLAVGGAAVIPSSDEPLDQFLQAAGKMFGKDPTKWEQIGACCSLGSSCVQRAHVQRAGATIACWVQHCAGQPLVDVTEVDGKRYIKSTGTFSGVELHLLVEVCVRLIVSWDVCAEQRIAKPEFSGVE
jgi:hypothetical protein